MLIHYNLRLLRCLSESCLHSSPVWLYFSRSLERDCEELVSLPARLVILSLGMRGISL